MIKVTQWFKISTILATLCFLAGVVACASPAPSPTAAPAPAPSSAPAAAKPATSATAAPPAAAATIKLTIGSEQSEDYPQMIQLKKWRAAVEEKTGGRVKFDYFPNGQLIATKESWDATSKGRIDMYAISPSNFTGVAPFLNFFQGTPFLFQSFVHYQKAMDAGINDIQNAVFEKANMKRLMYYSMGWNTFIGNKRMIKVPEDLRGQKVRVSNLASSELMSRLGASPVQMASSELYMSAKTGIIDALMAVPSTFMALKLYEVQKYVTNSHFTLLESPAICINLDVWKKLPKDIQDILTSESEKSLREYNNVIMQQEHDKAVKDIQDKGTTIYTLTKEDNALWETTCKPIWDWTLQTTGPDGKKALDIAVAAAK